MGILSLAAIFLGLGAPVVTPFIGRIAAGIANVPAITLTNGAQVFPTEFSQAVLSTPLVFVLLVGLLAVPLLAVALLGGSRAGQRTDAQPWACGYGYSYKMGVSASNFAQPMRRAYQPLFGLRSLLQMPLDGIAAFGRQVNEGLPGAEPFLERAISLPMMASVQYVGKRIQKLQMGDVRTYCLYIFAALAVLLVVIFM
jgi:hydrogenase-4 component B